MTYYHFKVKTTESDNRYTKLLADIKVKLNEVHKKQKGQYIQQLQEGKNQNKILEAVNLQPPFSTQNQ